MHQPQHQAPGKCKLLCNKAHNSVSISSSGCEETTSMSKSASPGITCRCRAQASRLEAKTDMHPAWRPRPIPCGKPRRRAGKRLGPCLQLGLQPRCASICAGRPARGRTPRPQHKSAQIKMKSMRGRTGIFMTSTNYNPHTVIKNRRGLVTGQSSDHAERTHAGPYGALWDAWGAPKVTFESNLREAFWQPFCSEMPMSNYSNQCQEPNRYISS